MALSRAKSEFIKMLIAEIESDPKPMSDFEKSFMSDQKERFGKYGSGTFFSPKQWAIIERVGVEKYSMGPPEDEE